MRNVLSLWVAVFGLLTCSFADINAVNGVTASTSSNINGVTTPSAVNGQTLAGGAAFNPQTQGTLVNWYDASVLGLANGANVATFTDSKTGAPNSLSGSAQFQTNQQNGLATANYNGTANAHGAAGGGSSASTFPYTIAAVIRISSAGAAYTILGSRSGNGGLQFRTDIITGTLTLNKESVANIGTSTGTVGTGAYHLVVCTVDSANYAFYIDGVAAGSGSHAQTLTAARTFMIGANNASEWFAGHIGEIQIYSSVLSSGDLSGLHTYIVNKWATP